MKTENSRFFLQPRNYDLHDYCFPSKPPLDNSIEKHRQSCKGIHSRRGTVPRAVLMHESEKVVAWFKKHFLGRRTYLMTAFQSLSRPPNQYLFFFVLFIHIFI